MNKIRHFSYALACLAASVLLLGRARAHRPLPDAIIYRARAGLIGRSSRPSG
jgi:hypothetical protein